VLPTPSDHSRLTKPRGPRASAWHASLRQNQGESKRGHPCYPKPPCLSRPLIAVYGLTKRTSSHPDDFELPILSQ
jgi:hypothetical protein